MSNLFERTFGYAPKAIGSAHGRVNLMGDHTDYSGGFVLPVCIPQATTVEIAERDDGEVRVVSEQMGAEVETFSIDSLERTSSWTDYIKGVLSVSQEHFEINGFDALIRSNVPVGSGLSSSAALEVGLLRALQNLCGTSLSDVEIAKLGRKAENDFVGAPVGIMDQMAASVGDICHALFLDTRTLEYDRIPVPKELGIIVIDSATPHNNAGGAYAERRSECERAAELLKLHELRDVAHIDDANALPKPLRQRAYHVISENARVLQMAAALQEKQFEEAGALMRESHESLRLDFDVSTAEIDRLVEIANADENIFGARITGGGFGGCIVALSPADKAANAAIQILERYRDASGRMALVVVPTA